MIKLIVLDVDGTLTNGDIVYTNSGDEIKTFNVKDGLGISAWIKLGGEVAIITGRYSKIVENRAKELGVKYLRQGIHDKYKELLDIIQLENIDIDNIAVIGDDLNDLKMLKAVKYSFAPNDATLEVKNIVYKILNNNGGCGAVREMIDFLMQKENLHEKLYEIFS